MGSNPLASLPIERWQSSSWIWVCLRDLPDHRMLQRSVLGLLRLVHKNSCSFHLGLLKPLLLKLCHPVVREPNQPQGVAHGQEPQVNFQLTTHQLDSHVSEPSLKRIFQTSWAADASWDRDEPTLPNSAQIVNLWAKNMFVFIWSHQLLEWFVIQQQITK